MSEKKKGKIYELPVCDICGEPVDEADAGGIEFYWCNECTNEIDEEDIEYGIFEDRNGTLVRIDKKIDGWNCEDYLEEKEHGQTDNQKTD